MLQPLLSLWGLPPPPRGSRSCSSLTPAHEVRFSPLPRTSSAPRLGFSMVGILSSSLTVGAELSNPFAQYLSVSIMWSCRGTLRLVTSAPHLRFAFGKASAAVTLVGRLKCLDVLPPPIPPSSTFVVFVPLLGYSYTHSPAGTLQPPFRGRSWVAIQRPAWVTPVLLAVANAALAHPPAIPHQSHLQPLSLPAIGHRFVPRGVTGAPYREVNSKVATAPTSK